MSLYEKSVFVGVGHDEAGIYNALQGTGRKDEVTYPLMPLAREYMHAIKDSRAEVLSVKVNSVNINPEFPRTVNVYFTVEWALYHGCDDRNEYDHEDMDESATYSDDGNLIFQVPSPRRPPSGC